MMRVEDIVSQVAITYGIDHGALLSKRRDSRIDEARGVAMLVARKVTGANDAEIGRMFDRDRTTIATAIATLETRIAKDSRLAACVKAIMIAADYRAALMASQPVDALALARRIAVNPRRQAAMTSAHEVTALAITFIELWEVVSAVEHLFTAGLEPDAVPALADVILSEIARIAGPDPEAAA